MKMFKFEKDLTKWYRQHVAPQSILPTKKELIDESVFVTISVLGMFGACSGLVVMILVGVLQCMKVIGEQPAGELCAWGLGIGVPIPFILFGIAFGADRLQWLRQTKEATTTITTNFPATIRDYLVTKLEQTRQQTTGETSPIGMAKKKNGELQSRATAAKRQLKDLGNELGIDFQTQIDRLDDLIGQLTSQLRGFNDTTEKIEQALAVARDKITDIVVLSEDLVKRNRVAILLKEVETLTAETDTAMRQGDIAVAETKANLMRAVAEWRSFLEDHAYGKQAIEHISASIPDELVEEGLRQAEKIANARASLL